MRNRPGLVVYGNGSRPGTGKVQQASPANWTVKRMVDCRRWVGHGGNLSGSEQLNPPLVGKVDGQVAPSVG